MKVPTRFSTHAPRSARLASCVVCGIAGIAGGRADIRAERVRTMCAQIVHRGPDSAGQHIATDAALGVRRLRVIDLFTGDQPIANEDGSVVAVFNGEIYNHRELRAELSSQGHRFITRTDTEVLVHLYEELGDGFVDRLEGMFAFAIWDERSRALVLARDRLGKKPLLWTEAEGGIFFASEHSALLAGLGVQPAIDPSALGVFLQLGYIPAPLDTFDGVHKLPPAHVLVWRAGQISVRRYWQLPEPGTLRISPQEAATTLRRLFEDAVARRLIADVPIGAFLSGGLDSSTVVATMAQLAGKVATFSIGFEESDYSELSDARVVAERYRTEHHELTVRALDMDILANLARHYGEPYADSSALPTYHLARMTREFVTVALNGDGGDEVFMGYDRYRALGMSAALDRLPPSLRGAVEGLARLLPSGDPRQRLTRLRRFFAVSALSPRQRYLAWVSIFDAAALNTLLSPELASTASPAAPHLSSLELFSAYEPQVAANLLDLGLYLPDDLLAKVDIASMACSLEVRSPFLDRRIVEFGVSLPISLKIHDGVGKWIVRQAFADTLPAQIRSKPKQGFGIPIGSWIRGHAKAEVRDVLLSTRARERGLFMPGAVERLLMEHERGAIDHGARLWTLLMLEFWFREVVDPIRPSAASSRLGAGARFPEVAREDA